MVSTSTRATLSLFLDPAFDVSKGIILQHFGAEEIQKIRVQQEQERLLNTAADLIESKE